jgi:hypothetical protein
MLLHGSEIPYSTSTCHAISSTAISVRASTCLGRSMWIEVKQRGQRRAGDIAHFNHGQVMDQPRSRLVGSEVCPNNYITMPSTNATRQHSLIPTKEKSNQSHSTIQYDLPYPSHPHRGTQLEHRHSGQTYRRLPASRQEQP